MGYNSEQIIAIPDISKTAKQKYPLLKEELENETGIVGVTTSLMLPSQEIVDKGQISISGKKDNTQTPFCDVLPVEKDFVEVMKMKLLAGNSFRKYISTVAAAQQFKTLKDYQSYFNTTDRVYLLNQMATKVLGWNSPDEALGKQISVGVGQFELKNRPVIGVLRDFHFTSLHHKINPTVLFVEPIWYNNVLIRINSHDIDNTLSIIKQVWNKINPEYPFNYIFISDAFAAEYKDDNQFKGVISSIFINCYYYCLYRSIWFFFFHD